MNDHDLEEQLRSQRGPREEGYTPMPLPTSLEASRNNAGPSGLVRAGMFAGAAAAGVVVIVLAAGFFSRSAPGVGSSTPSPSAAATCDASDVAFGAEPWGGAAGSRGTVVTVSLAMGASACALPGPIGAQISNAGGTLVSGMPQAAAPSVELEPGAAYTIGIAWSNYCGPDPTPVTLSLTVPGWASPAPVAAPAGAEAVPPCNGQSSPTTLSVTALELPPS